MLWELDDRKLLTVHLLDVVEILSIFLLFLSLIPLDYLEKNLLIASNTVFLPFQASYHL